jgi:hypothetical protein
MKQNNALRAVLFAAYFSSDFPQMNHPNPLLDGQFTASPSCQTFSLFKCFPLIFKKQEGVDKYF